MNTLRKEFQVSLDWLITNEDEMFLPRKLKKEEKKRLDFGKYSEEINELLFHMEKVPMLRHAILGFFLEYRLKNQHIIQQVLEESSPLRRSELV